MKFGYKKKRDDKSKNHESGDLAIVSSNDESGESYKEYEGGHVLLGDDHSCKVVGIGNVQFKLYDGTTRTLNSVRNVPGLRRNLISLGMLDDAGYISKNKNGKMRISKSSFFAFKGIEKNGLYVLLGEAVFNSCNASVQTPADNIVKVWLILLKSKDEAFSKFQEWKLLVEKQVNRSVKALRTDNGLEFCNKEFNNFCKTQGILRHRTIKHTPQQNDVAERMNRTLLDKVRCMPVSSGLPKLFLGEAVMTAMHLVNLSPSTVLNFQSPESIWSGKMPNYGHLRVFGYAAYAHQSGKT
nr:uncharacterized protein LOC125422662 [Ziziphus jujuba var. spinosa]